MSLYIVFHCIYPVLTAEQTFQLAQRLYGASRIFFLLPWLVADGEGAYDKNGRKIPSYGVCAGFDAGVAEYMRSAEKKLLEQLHGLKIEGLKCYRPALRVMRSGYEKWEV